MLADSINNKQTQELTLKLTNGRTTYCTEGGRREKLVEDMEISKISKNVMFFFHWKHPTHH